MNQEFYNTKDISQILGICYAKALAFVKYSGINYLKINRTYLVSKEIFKKFITENKNINVEL